MSDALYTQEPPPEDGWYFFRHKGESTATPAFFALQPDGLMFIFELGGVGDWDSYARNGGTVNHHKLEAK